MNNTDLNNVTNNLILQYDEKFNELYDTKSSLDASITNKEELILKINDEITYKNNTIYLIQCQIILLILFGAALIAYGLTKIDFKKLMICIVLLIIIYAIIYYNTKFKKIVNEVKIDMATYIADKIENTIPYKCPTTCPPKQDAPSASYTSIQGYEQPTLCTDSQLNVWQYGDMATD